MENYEVTESGILLDRRQILGGASAVGLGAMLGAGTASAQSTPKKGGTLRVGMEGGSPSDSLDPRTYADSIPIMYSLMFWNMLVEIDNNGKPIGELAESWEVKPGAKEWTFNLRKGITFTSGKTFSADDAIYSIGIHRGETKSPAKSLLESITEIKKLGSHQIQFTLKDGNADFPAVLSDYHLIMVPAGTTDFSKPDGTGAFTLAEWQPGTRVVGKRKPGAYWKKDRGHFDTVEIRYIIDTAARSQALQTGQVDAINRVNPKTVELLAKNPNLKINRTKGAGNRFAFVAHVDVAPYNNKDVMLGLKYAIDREKIVKNVWNGYATVGKDHTIGPAIQYHDHSLQAKAYDPDKAKFHFKKAGISGPFELQTSDGAFSGAVDAALVFQESAKAAGADLQVKKVSGDGYWDNVWLKAPFCAVYWGNRPTADLGVSQTFMSTAAWNDTHYRSEKFDNLVRAARVETDDKKRAVMYADVQRMIADEAGMICFAIGDAMDAHNVKVQGLVPHARYDMNDQRLPEKGWFA